MLTSFLSFVRTVFGGFLDLFTVFSAEFKALVLVALIFLICLAIKRIVF